MLNLLPLFSSYLDEKSHDEPLNEKKSYSYKISEKHGHRNELIATQNLQLHFSI